jgi:alanine racemase
MKRNAEISEISNTLPVADCRLLSGRPTWVEVDLHALTDNFKALSSLLAASLATPRVIPVIKANSYGHGMIPVATALASAGATLFAVGIVDEGVHLRQAGILQEILVLGTTWAGQEMEALKNRLMLSVDNPDCVQRLDAAAKILTSSASIHIKVDTGMARLGASWNTLTPLLTSIRQANHVCLKGIFSHLSSSDEKDPAFTLEQIRRFEHSLSVVQESGLNPGEIHLANSAGILHYERLRCWGARTGIALYGYSPDSQRSPLKLRPVLAFKTRVGLIRSLQVGESIGYNRRFTASRNTRAAILPVGYADGFSRRMGNRGRVILHDQWAPGIGTVSMDMIAVDLTDLPEAKEGDEVILLGSSSHCRISADEWAVLLETIPYEVLCAIATRVPRIYI